MVTILTLTTLLFAGTTVWMWRRWLALNEEIGEHRRERYTAEKRWETAHAETRRAREQAGEAIKEHTQCVRKLAAAKLEIDQMRGAFPSQLRRLFIALDTSLGKLVKDLSDAGLEDEARAQTHKRTAIQTILNELISHRLDEDLLTVFSQQSSKVSKRVADHVH